jgi:hypothetical protein
MTEKKKLKTKEIATAAAFVLVMALFVFGGDDEKPAEAEAPAVAAAADTGKAEAQAARQALVERAIASVPKMPKWDRVEIRRLERNGYTLALWYKDMPNQLEVSSDTRMLVQSVLKELVASGQNPQADWTSVIAHGYRAEKGQATGADMVRIFGRAAYDFNSDSIQFDAK